jgi:phage-related tail protein
MSVEFEEMKQILRETDKIVKENALEMAELQKSQRESQKGIEGVPERD